jgi:hypothetical protein
MEEIKAKIKQLLLLSSTEPKEGKDYWDNLSAKMQQQEKMWNELKVLAQANNTLLGRIMKFQHADSHAYYVITKVNKSTVRLDWLNYCDAWVDDRCGYACTMDINYANQQIKRVDALAELFSR